MAGLGHGDTDQGFPDIDFAFYLTSVGTVIIYEGGVCRGEVSSYIAGDSFRVQTVGSVVSYLQNGEVVYTSSLTPTLPLLFDTSLYSTNASIQAVAVTETPFWNNAIGISVLSNSLTKTAANGWNGRCIHGQSIAVDGYATFTTAEANTDKMAGLSHGDTDQGFADIDFRLLPDERWHRDHLRRRRLSR